MRAQEDYVTSVLQNMCPNLGEEGKGWIAPKGGGAVPTAAEGILVTTPKVGEVVVVD